ncbi:MAG TPA: hypothetical protein VMW16_09885, partial [Sedimentisphaerales bacterium]|nr:hypothetical protein [Sedimentisphaerales bacterium]
LLTIDSHPIATTANIKDSNAKTNNAIVIVSSILVPLFLNQVLIVIGTDANELFQASFCTLGRCFTI